MARGISIEISARDHYSDAIKAMQTANRSFNKDLDGLQGKLNALDKTKASLSFETDNAKKAMKEAQKAFEAMDDTLKDDSGVKAATENYKNVQRNLQLVAKEARSAEKDMMNLTSTQSKSENRASGVSKGMMASLKDAGLTKMVGDSISGALSVGITSAFGSNVGNAVGSVMTGIASGAALGSMAGPAGTAVGAVVGGAAGALNAGTQYFTKQDDAFKGVVQNQYGIQQARIQDDLASGSDISAQREMDEIAFSKLMGGKDIASKFLGGIKDMANTTPFQYEDLTQMSKVLSAYKYNPDEIKTLLTQVGDTGAALGMDANGMSAVSTSLGRMKSSDKTSLEYLNPLVERGIPALDYLAESLGKTKAQIYDDISKGKLSGEKSAQIIAEAMGKDNAGAMAEQGQTYAGLKSTVEGLKKEDQTAMGTGYNEERKKGLSEQKDYLSNTAGREGINSMIGEYEASLDNLHDKTIREAEAEAYEFIRREHLTGAAAGKELKLARVQAEADYMASEGMQQEIAMQEALVDGIQSAMEEGDVYKNFGMRMGEEFSKGLANAVGEKMMKTLDPNTYLLPTASSSAAAGSKNGIHGSPASTSNSAYSANNKPAKIEDESGNRAYGMGYVPYNDFPARLHEGEAILTANQNRQYREGGTQPITITGNSFSVREEADVYAIAQEIARQVERARELM